MQTSNRIWFTALIVALVVHAGTALGVRAARFLEPSETPPPKHEPLEFTFAEPQDDPQIFTEQPEDRQEDPPEDPDFLSNVDAKARDNSQGDQALPQMNGDLDFPSVPTEAGEPTPVTPENQPENQEPAEDVPSPSSNRFSGLTRPGYQAPSTPPKTSGNFDLPQRPMTNPDGGAVLDGNISLSTTAWEFAPWLMAFKRQFMKHWRAPYAYYSGLISGWCDIELMIDQDGSILSSEIVRENGDHSLAQVGLIAFNTAAPYLPLPKDFPEETLTIGIRLLYPPLRR